MTACPSDGAIGGAPAADRQFAFDLLPDAAACIAAKLRWDTTPGKASARHGGQRRYLCGTLRSSPKKTCHLDQSTSLLPANAPRIFSSDPPAKAKPVDFNGLAANERHRSMCAQVC